MVSNIGQSSHRELNPSQSRYPSTYDLSKFFPAYSEALEVEALLTASSPVFSLRKYYLAQSLSHGRTALMFSLTVSIRKLRGLGHRTYMIPIDAGTCLVCMPSESSAGFEKLPHFSFTVDNSSCAGPTDGNNGHMSCPCRNQTAYCLSQKCEHSRRSKDRTAISEYRTIHITRPQAS